MPKSDRFETYGNGRVLKVGPGGISREEADKLEEQGDGRYLEPFELGGGKDDYDGPGNVYIPPGSPRPKKK